VILDHIYISITIFAIALAASSIVLTSAITMWRKLLIVTLLCGGGMISYRGFNKFYGYPTMLQQSFDKVLVLGYLVDKKSKVIYLWLKNENEDPRSYTMPFNHKMAKFLENKRRQNKGKPFNMKLKVKTNQTNPFGNSINDVEPGEFPVLPPKVEIYDKQTR
jgi:hypothetical protein